MRNCQRLVLVLPVMVGLPLFEVRGVEVLLQTGRNQGGRPVRLLRQQLVLQGLHELAVSHVQLAFTCTELAGFTRSSSTRDISRGPDTAPGSGTVLSQVLEVGWQNGEPRCS